MTPFTTALLSSGFTFLCTALGASLVFLLGHSRKVLLTQLSLGFSAGIMISASIFGLLIPAQKEALAQGYGMTPISGGFILGVLFIIALDRMLPHLHMLARSPEGPKTSLSKQALLFLAITIHNIPEGMAVGVCAAAAAASGSAESTGALIALAVGIGIQNIPEGTAVSIPYYASGMKRSKAFILGSLSGIVEPIGAILVVIFSDLVVSMLPWFLSFAAGAMLYVVIEELIPESHNMGNKESDLATISVLSGFLLMLMMEALLG